ncbi:uncharacterized protein [Spinacia oleracea]|uniref:GRF-type domain-containing protein n=1 Tax=Spinacia oleracea TaxID=3562 RepID=A0A9R0IWR9_SPIOL|nr:uncharacterized protein LOC110796233 [Spinacia oleracea]
MAPPSPLSKQKCYCGLPVARLTSWTRDNPGRKFIACQRYDPVTETRGCKKFEWLDEEDCVDWQRNVTNALLLDKKLLKVEVNALKSEVDDLSGQRRCLLNESDNLKLKCKALMSEVNKLKEGNHNTLGKLNHIAIAAPVLCMVFVMFFKA